MGNEITGARAKVGAKLSSTWGTAGTISTMDGMEVLNLAWNDSSERLQTTPIGSGDVGLGDVQRGPTSPGWSLEKVMHYNDEGNAIIKSFFGAESVVAQQSTWAHSWTMNESFNTSFTTLAHQVTTTSIIEYPTSAITRLGFSAATGDYVKMSCDALADQMKLTSQTNSFAILSAANIANNERVVCDASDEFLINVATGSALATPTDRVNVSTFAVEYSREMQHVRECKGAAGNGEPIATGNPPFAWTVTITIPRPQNIDFFHQLQQGTEFKAQFTVSGNTIANGIPTKVVWYFPRLKIIDSPAYDFSSPGINPMTVKFEGLVASTIPTGFYDPYPYIVQVNNKSTWNT